MFSLINFQDHPSNRNKKVFFFRNEDHANYFENLLIQHQLKYEKQVDEEGDQTIYFGVGIGDFKLSKHLNYLTIGHFRKPFIPDSLFRYSLITVSILILLLAIIGSFMSS